MSLQRNRWFSPPASMTSRLTSVTFKMASKEFIEETDIILFFLHNNIFLFYFIFICHTIITKNIRKEEKKKWRGDLRETIAAYERLGLLELRARAVSHQLKKRWRKVEDGKIYRLFSYLLNNLVFSYFLFRIYHGNTVPIPWIWRF